MFKEDLRKEVALRKINKEYPLKFIQLSSSFFKKDTDLTEEEIAKENDMTLDDITMHATQTKDTAQQNNTNVDNDALSEGETLCLICYERPPNVIIEPCGHGGVCSTCVLNLIQKEKICPLCREKMETIYVIQINKNDKKVKLDQEITLSVDDF